MALEAGKQAPDFSLYAKPEQAVSLRSFGGRPWSHVSPIDVNPGADAVLEIVESMEGRKP